MNQVILVDQDDQVLGTMEKIQAHKQGLLHRAFSVFIFTNPQQPQVLLQQRNWDKYHCGGLWTNTCCSHPKPHETTLEGAQRRLQEEMGIVTELTYANQFIYKASFSNGLTEHELDHVFIGWLPSPQMCPVDSNEVNAYRWVPIANLQQQNTKAFTPWFFSALNIALKAID